jgi:hypothetical protein
MTKNYLRGKFINKMLMVFQEELKGILQVFEEIRLLVFEP